MIYPETDREAFFFRQAYDTTVAYYESTIKTKELIKGGLKNVEKHLEKVSVPMFKMAQDLAEKEQKELEEILTLLDQMIANIPQ
jgi:hypothetical protein